MNKDKTYKSLPDKMWLSTPKNSEENGSINFELEDKWVMEIVNEKGVRKINFNTKEFPDLAADDFAKQVIKIMHESSLLNDLIEQEVEARLNNKEK